MWSDGEQVNADDVQDSPMTPSPAISSRPPRKANLDNIESIEVLDPLTIQVIYAEVKCDALN